MTITVPAGRYSIPPQLDDTALTGQTTAENITITGDTLIDNGIKMPNLPGPYGNDSTAASNGVAIGELYFDNNGHVLKRRT